MDFSIALRYNITDMSVIKVDNLKKHFGKTKAVDGISFAVEKGEIFGFLGPNGAGKTTTIRCMMDFIRPDDGTVTILGKDAQKDAVELKEKIGYLPGNVHLYDHWNGQTHIDFLRKLNGEAGRAAELIKRLKFDPTVRTKKLSSGNRQKLAVILAFMTDPEVLIADEPTNALDPMLQSVVYDLISEASERGVTIFMSSHNLDDVERVCSRIGIIKEGKIVDIEDITDIKEKHLYTVRAYFKADVDPKEFESDSIKIDKVANQSFEMTVKGDIDAVVKQLAKYDLRDVDISRARLEEIFMEYYE